MDELWAGITTTEYEFGGAEHLNSFDGYILGSQVTP
jgi:hypothetical protein